MCSFSLSKLKYDLLVVDKTLKPKTIFVEIDESLVPYQIKKVSLHKSMLLRIQFVDVASEYLANQIIKKKTYIHINDLQRLDEKDFYFEEIIGFEIIDSNLGKIGIVQSINSQTPQTLAMVKNIEGNLVIIPLVNAFINDINKKEKQIIVNLPSIYNYFHLHIVMRRSTNFRTKQ